LGEIASYGISMQLIFVLSGMGVTYITTYVPKIAKLRVEGNSPEIADLYLKGQLVLVATYFAGGIALITLGEWAINLIGSETHFLPPPILFAALLISLLETGHRIAALILLSKNEVPFLKPSLLSAAATILLMLLLLETTSIGVWAIVLAPGIVQACYQNWKWPLEVHLELGISSRKILSGSWLRG
jgi:O-antigen/teichoic acid export membrane protein